MKSEDICNAFTKMSVSTNCLEEKQILLTVTRYTTHFKISVLAFSLIAFLLLRERKQVGAEEILRQ